VFTGLVADLGTVASAERGEEGARLRIATALAPEIGEGDSVAVNGVCLTAAAVADGAFEADVMNQTLSVTSLGPVEPGDRVNLELALRASDRMGGHIVQGHVDGTAEVAAFAKRVELAVSPELARYVVEHGSVTLDGVSLTVAALTERGFEVSLIPETLERTNLGTAEPGRVVNVEVDVVARYVERLLSREEQP
jgi:riboflavin synthase